MISMSSSKMTGSLLTSPSKMVVIIILIWFCSEKSFLPSPRLITDLTPLKSSWRRKTILKTGNFWEAMDWVFQRLRSKKRWFTQQVLRQRKTGTRLTGKSRVISWSMVRNLGLTQEWHFSSRFSRTQTLRREKRWWRVSSHQTEQCFQQTGRTWARRTTREKTGHRHQRDKSGKRGSIDDLTCNEHKLIVWDSLKSRVNNLLN